MSNEIAKVQSSELAVPEFAVFSDLAENIQEVIADNFEGETFSPSDLTKISVPAAGGTTFELETAEGVVETKTLVGIIIKAQPVRMYFSKEFGTTEDVLPDCMSTDMITGEGEPGGVCAECPFNQWGSDPKGGAGKACSERRNVYLILKDDLLPCRLSCPTMSIKTYKQYIQKISRSGLPLSSVITEITLQKEKSQTGVAFSMLQFAMKGQLPKEYAQKMKEYRRSFEQVLAGPKFD